MNIKKMLISLVPIYLGILGLVLFIAAAGSRTVTAYSENAITDNRRCIIIDAGHGGVDGGATSCTGVLESAINLDIALRLEDLSQLLGIKTVMIRRTDCSVYTEGESIAAKKVSDLKNRVNIANQTADAILVSIHQNYYSDSKYSGAQVFYGKEEGSAVLAKQLQSAFVTTVNPGSNRKARKASGIYLMNNIKCTGILVECGFLSNVHEEQLLRDAEYQKKLCCVIASTCNQYLYAPTA